MARRRRTAWAKASAVARSDRGGELFARRALAALTARSSVIAAIHFPSFFPEAIDLLGGGLGEPTFAAPKPRAQRFKFRETGQRDGQGI